MMRRFFLSILVSAGCVTMQAAEVNQQKAQETAKAFMTQMMSQQAGTRRAKDGISLKTVETGLKGLHVFNMDGGNGFVIEHEQCGLRLDTILRLRQPEHPYDATDTGDGVGMAEHDL